MLQIATSKGRGGRRKLPFAFTEHGALMAANVLNSKQAVRASVACVRAFVRLRQMLVSNAELAGKLGDLERKYNSQFKDTGERRQAGAIQKGRPQAAFLTAIFNPERD